MTLTRHARNVVAARKERRDLAQREEYRAKLLRLQRAFEPPLSNAELSSGLGLETPREGEAGASTVARFLSDSARWRRARPDGETRALIDALLEGELLIAARTAMPGARREVLVCEERDVALLAPGWQLLNLAGRPLPKRREKGKDWEDSALWDLFEPAPVPTPTPGPTVLPAPRPVPAAQSFAGAAAPAPILAEFLRFPIGFGAMRLSTASPAGTRPDEAAAVALLVAALEAGVRCIDSADSYCLDESEVGHNEALVRRALYRWGGDAASVLVATKAGLRRPGGKWIPDGRPEHLRACCEASLRRLGRDTIDLFQLHTPDTKVPWLDSVGELARLRAEGKIRHVGLSNVDLFQLAEARREVEISSVQNALSFFDSSALRSGLWQACRERGTLLIAHSPLGGHRDVGKGKKSRAEGDPELQRLAARQGLSPYQIALAWLLSWPGILPIPGATRSASLAANLAAAAAELAGADLASLDRRAEARSRTGDPLPPRPPAAAPQAAPRPGTDAPARLAGQPTLGDHALPHESVPSGGEELVLFVGPPAAGKTSRVEPFLAAGYERLNRDLVGGKLEGLLPLLRRHLQQGCRRFVLDNTYATREQRRPVLQIAREAGLRTRVIHLDVPVEEALYNACLRMLERHGKILDPEEIKRLSRRDPNLLPPAAIYRFFEVYEAPSESEGIHSLEKIPFVRRTPPGFERRALIVDIDGTVRGTRDGARFPRHPDEVELLPHRRETLLRWRAAGYRLLAVSNQAHIGLGQVKEEVARACFDRLLELLGFDIEIHYCPHPPIPAGVWARKPMPGLGVMLIEKHLLDRKACVFVGDQEVDRLFAHNVGFEFRTPEEIFVSVDKVGNSERMLR